MCLGQFLGRLPVWRKARTSPAPTAKRSDSQKKSERGQESPVIHPETIQTASNVLYFALRTLSSISSNIPLGGLLSGIIEPLLDITGRIQQTSANAQGLIQLAARIDRLTPILSDMAERDPIMGQTIVDNLQQELWAMTKDLEVARSRGKLNQFFNSADNASSLERHNMALAQMIADSTLVTLNEVLKSLREMENKKLQDPSSSEPPIVLSHVCGGLGGTGGNAHIGGEGGEGGGPQLRLDADERYKLDKISGGIGGTGGVGVELGGKGGTGKGPVI
ncbi:hypothetical protein DFH08DRAFT_1078313, partial [Mycena albidolilacea]